MAVALAGAPAEAPIGFTQVLAVAPFRGLLAAHSLSVVGDQVTRIALASLVYDRSGSAALSALTYAATYLPWVLGATVLADVADRRPRRDVLLGCDVGRAVLVALMLVPGLPLVALLGLALASSLLEPPFGSARAALIPDLLRGDSYVVGSAAVSTVNQLGQVLGFLLGGLLVAGVGTGPALALDALTFAVSAVVIRLTVPRGPAPEATPDTGRSRLFGGLAYVMGDAALRSLVVLAWVGAACVVVAEGLAVPLARSLGATGVGTGVLLAAIPAGAVVGSLALARLVRPAQRFRLLRPLALLSAAALVPSVVVDSLPALVVLWFVAGLGLSYNLPANAAFVAGSRPELRGRAFAVAQGGLMLGQGLAVVVGALLTTVLPVAATVATAGALGLALVAAVPLRGLDRISPVPL